MTLETCEVPGLTWTLETEPRFKSLSRPGPRRISSARSNKHCTAPSRHQQAHFCSAAKVQKAALSSLTFLAQVPGARWDDGYQGTWQRHGAATFNTTASMRSVTSSAGGYESPVLCTSVLQLRGQHMRFAAHAFRQDTKQIIGMLYRRVFPSSCQRIPKDPSLFCPPLATARCPALPPVPRLAGWADCRRFCLPRHPPILSPLVWCCRTGWTSTKVAAEHLGGSSRSFSGSNGQGLCGSVPVPSTRSSPPRPGQIPISLFPATADLPVSV